MAVVAPISAHGIRFYLLSALWFPPIMQPLPSATTASAPGRISTTGQLLRKELLMTEEEKNAFARYALSDWLEETPPFICEKGMCVVWFGYKRRHGYVVRYEITIEREALSSRKANIYVNCNNMSMYDWMVRHTSYLKGKLIWYCRAVWDLFGDRLLDPKDFDRSRDDAWFSDEPSEEEEEYEDLCTENFWKCKRYQNYTEQKYGYDYS